MRQTKPIKDFYENGELKAGHSFTRLYGIWVGIKTRCYNPHDKKYSNYGGKGVLMCEEWINDFSTFAKWSIEHGYKENLTIDRIDVEKGYSPDNCRWADMKTQQNNRSNNHRLELNGQSHTIMEWSRITGLNDTTIYGRLKRGWSVEETLTRPLLSFSEAGTNGCKKRYGK